MFGVLALGGVGMLFGASIYSSSRARREQRKATRVQSRMESRQMQRERQQILRQSQIAQAMGEQMAATSGVTDSSGFAGAQAGIRASALSNLAFSHQAETGAGQMQRFMNRASTWQGRSAAFGAAAQFGMTAMSAFGGQGEATQDPREPVRRAAATGGGFGGAGGMFGGGR